MSENRPPVPMDAHQDINEIIDSLPESFSDSANALEAMQWATTKKEVYKNLSTDEVAFDYTNQLLRALTFEPTRREFDENESPGALIQLMSLALLWKDQQIMHQPIVKREIGNRIAEFINQNQIALPKKAELLHKANTFFKKAQLIP